MSYDPSSSELSTDLAVEEELISESSGFQTFEAIFLLFSPN
jgi:hypothetical protein